MTETHDKIMNIIEAQDLIRHLWADETDKELKEMMNYINIQMTNLLNMFEEE